MLPVITLALALIFQQDTPPPTLQPTVWELLQEKYDINGDAKISPKEHGRGEDAFRNLDANGDGFLTQADTEASHGGSGGRANKRKKRMHNRMVQPPKVGEVAPDFELQVLVHEAAAKVKESKPSKQAEGKQGSDKAHNDQKSEPQKPKTLRLSSFAGNKPVALIFGSYT